MASFFRKKLKQKNLLLPFVSFDARDGTDSSHHSDEIVSTNAANRDPYSQWHVQAEI